MENRLKHVLLTGSLLISGFQFSSVCLAEENIQVIEPDLNRREIKTDAIDSENFEVGFYYGVLSIQDFSSNEVYGLRAAYHVTEDIFFEAAYGQSEGDLTSFEKLSGGSPILSDNDRDYKYYSASLGWNIFPGEVFVLNDYSFNSAIYLIAGVGSTEFAGDSWFTVNFGAGFRLLLTDEIAWHIDVRDHMFDRDIFADSETTHNVEFTTGFTVFF
ncbi:MAG: outer membrane beta-barrel domain-containing protein [Spongiibacteraceae bacterium]